MDLMYRLFSPYLDKFVVVFVDDILIYSKSKEDQEKYLRVVLQTLRDNKLYAKSEKCDFLKNEVEILRFEVFLVWLGWVLPEIHSGFLQYCICPDEID